MYSVYQALFHNVALGMKPVNLCNSVHFVVIDVRVDLMDPMEAKTELARLGIEPRIFGLQDRRLATWPPSHILPDLVKYHVFAAYE